jgi:prepilin-type N-terminal cleavage/methylation domain-containing protein
MNGLRKEILQKAQKETQQKGFTIIEVVLVLAIAGLIFLMVFIALPALQASQRDTARKNDVSTVAAGVTEYTTNNRGSFPTTASIASYAKNVSDNSTSTVVKPLGTTTVTATDGEIDIVQSAACGTATGASESLTSGTIRQFVVITRLEAGGGVAYCQDS